jgi:glucokinase
MILAGDIGGTKTNLALYDWTTERVEPVREDSFHSADYKTLEEIIEEFLSAPLPKPPAEDELGNEPVEAPAEETTEAPELPPEPIKLTAACFGVAGPVIDNRCRTTNLPWVIDGATLAERFAIPQVRLLNDLEATAHGLLLLNPDEIVVLNAGTPPKKKQALALIAAGTGLGECILYWDGTRYRPMPSEGGHTDFAPNSDSEIDLLRHLRGSYLHVSYERIVSGPGLHAIYEYLRDTKKMSRPGWRRRSKSAIPPQRLPMPDSRDRPKSPNRPLIYLRPFTVRKPATWRSRRLHSTESMSPAGSRPNY